MTAQELKNSILQLAVQGKLVPQDKNDEPVSELLKRIQAEKAKLIKEGKIKKEKALPPITEEELPFDIPESWEWVRHNELFEISGGAQPDKSLFIELPKKGYVRLYQTRDYGKNPVPVYIPEHTATKRTKKGEILLARYGASLGKIFWAEEGAYNVALAKSIPLYEENSILPKYVFYYYHSFLYQSLVTTSSRSAQAGFNKNDLIALLFPIPPLAEQQRIVDKIEELLPLVEEYGKAETRLKELNADFPDMLRKSILQQAVQGKLTERNPEDEPASELLKCIQAEKAQLIKDGKLKKEKPLPPITEDEIPFDIPDNWEWGRIGDIFLTSSGTTPLKSNSKYYENGIYNWVRTTDLNNATLSSCEIKVSQTALEECRLSIIPHNSVCVAMYGGAGTIGKNALIDFDTTINQSVCAIHPNGFVNMKYVQIYLHFYRPFWMLKASGSRQDPNINQIIIKNAVIPIPPFAEQKRIVARVEELLALCDQLK